MFLPLADTASLQAAEKRLCSRTGQQNRLNARAFVGPAADIETFSRRFGQRGARTDPHGDEHRGEGLVKITANRPARWRGVSLLEVKAGDSPGRHFFLQPCQGLFQPAAPTEQPDQRSGAAGQRNRTNLSFGERRPPVARFSPVVGMRSIVNNDAPRARLLPSSHEFDTIRRRINRLIPVAGGLSPACGGMRSATLDQARLEAAP